jgi:hypothetical protein
MSHIIPELCDLLIQRDFRISTKKCYSTSEIIIEEPVFILDSLNNCYSHAVIDNCFSMFWAICDLIHNNVISSKNVRIFIIDKQIEKCGGKDDRISLETKQYKGVWDDVIKLITPYPVIFQHLSTSDYLLKLCISFKNDNCYKWQRTPWNCEEYYWGRYVSKQNVIFSDDKIYTMLQLFRLHVLNTCGLTEPILNNDMIIIDRRYNRKIKTSLLREISCEADKFGKINFKGVVFLEDLTFQEQVHLFYSTRFFIFRHGSALVNLLWAQKSSVVFEITGGHDCVNPNPMVISRLCSLTQSKQVILKYDNIDPSVDIFPIVNLDLGDVSQEESC